MSPTAATMAVTTVPARTRTTSGTRANGATRWRSRFARAGVTALLLALGVGSHPTERHARAPEKTASKISAETLLLTLYHRISEDRVLATKPQQVLVKGNCFAVAVPLAPVQFAELKRARNRRIGEFGLNFRNAWKLTQKLGSSLADCGRQLRLVIRKIKKWRRRHEFLSLEQHGRARREQS